MDINRVFDYMNVYIGFVYVSGSFDKLNMIVKNNNHAFEIHEAPKSYRIKLWCISGEKIELIAEHKHETKAGFKKFKDNVIKKYEMAGGSLALLNKQNICFSYESHPWKQ